MTLYDAPTTRLERVTPRAVPPRYTEDSVRGPLVAVLLVAPVGFVIGRFAWDVLIALMVIHVMVR